MTEATKWYSLEVTTVGEAAEAIEFALNSLDALGTSINHLRKANAESVTVVGYFNELPDDQRVQDELHYALRSYGFSEEIVTSVTRGEIENADWLAEWKKHWKPTIVGRFVIAPSWFEVNELNRKVIRIEPNMAFGTGTHDTTQLCVAEIDSQFHEGESFLDVGTGTGILAIAAAKLGASSIYACDTDVDSISIASENAVANDADGIIFEVATITADTPDFDFVCANLTIDVILPMLDILLAKTRRVLVMSGILAEQETAITSALRERRINQGRIERSGEWISVTVTTGR